MVKRNRMVRVEFDTGHVEYMRDLTKQEANEIGDVYSRKLHFVTILPNQKEEQFYTGAVQCQE